MYEADGHFAYVHNAGQPTSHFNVLKERGRFANIILPFFEKLGTSR